MSTLEPFECAGCGARALLRDLPSYPCPYCGAALEPPPAWRSELRAREAEDRVRREVEPHWQALTHVPRREVEWGASLAVFLLPPLSTALVQRALWPPLSPASVLTVVALPALLPGAVLWAWAASLRATLVDLRRAMSARPAARAGGPPECRACGAPLAPAPDELSARCAYCRSDSLVRDLPPLDASRARRRHAARTLSEATTALARRRRLLALGLGSVALFVGALSISLGLVLRAALW